MTCFKTLAATAATLAVCAAAHAELIVNDVNNVDFTSYVPCANGGYGEDVYVSGPVHELITFTINDKHVRGKEQGNAQGVVGIGQSSGDTYRAVGVGSSSFSGSLQNGQYTQQGENVFNLIGQGTGSKFLLHENYSLTFNANGDIVSSHDDFRVECR